MIARLRQWARALKREISALALAYADPRTPWYARIVAACVVAYALSPLDLIPDVIPVLGLLDDLLLLPLGIALAIRLIPPAVLAESRAKAASAPPLTPNRLVATLVIILWLIAAIALIVFLWQRF
jgi:uncharacterized membrane protein YkvA (DUF1232 family)